MTDDRLEDVVFEETGATEIPAMPLYVVARNTFYSGWGPAGDRAVYDVFPCESREQADLVAKTSRDPLIDLTNVRIVEKAPAPAPDRVLVIRSPRSRGGLGRDGRGRRLIGRTPAKRVSRAASPSACRSRRGRRIRPAA